MLKFLAARFVPNYQDPTNPQARKAYGMLSGAMGVALNFILFCIKLPIGLITGSMAILSDAFNNLTDIASSVITLVGMRLSLRRPDEKHPFGHGRAEYIAALAVALVILLVGFELMKESFFQLKDPHPLIVTPLMGALLALSALVKLFMYRYNRRLGRLIGSCVVEASAIDSRNDCITTVVAALAAIISRHVNLPVDSAAGFLLSLMIMYSGYGIVRSTIDQLLGGKPDPELARRIIEVIGEDERIEAVHDLIIHDYGPGRMLSSAHITLSRSLKFSQVHQIADLAEQRVEMALNIPLVIHADPIQEGAVEESRTRCQLERALEHYAPGILLEDLTMEVGPDTIDLHFSLRPESALSPEEKDRLQKAIARAMTDVDSRYQCHIRVLGTEKEALPPQDGE